MKAEEVEVFGEVGYCTEDEVSSEEVQELVSKQLTEFMLGAGIVKIDVALVPKSIKEKPKEGLDER